MLRRDIFNLIFTTNAAVQPDLDTPDPVVDTPAYLLTNHSVYYSQEFTNPEGCAVLNPELLSAFAFSISFRTSAPSASLTAGVLEGSEGKTLPVSFGIREGYLYISDLTHETKIGFDKIKQGLLIKLCVNPQPGNRSYAKLQLQDQSGLTLSVLKSSVYCSSDWEGAICSSGAVTSISVTGRRAIIQPAPIIT
jgi:hypothetical protein